MHFENILKMLGQRTNPKFIFRKHPKLSFQNKSKNWEVKIKIEKNFKLYFENIQKSDRKKTNDVPGARSSTGT